MDNSNVYQEVETASNDDHKLEEEKALNTSAFHRNIRHEESEYSPSLEEQSFGRNEAGLNSTLYGFRLKSLCTLVITALICSILAVGLSAYSIVKYIDAAKELQTARESRGMLHVSTGWFLFSQSYKTSNEICVLSKILQLQASPVFFLICTT